ncbi:MAG: hypothetical protein AAF696_29695 [Bacteroidota bacterium]
MKKFIILLVAILWIYSSNWAQSKKRTGLNSVGPQLDIGILNVLHPSAPSLDIGLGYRFSRDISAEVHYGLQTKRLIMVFIDDMLEIDAYHKFWLSLKFHMGENTLLSRLLKRRLRSSFSEGAYLAIEAYYARGNSRFGEDYAVLGASRVDYLQAFLEKEVRGIAIKGGWENELSDKWYLDISYGVGILSVFRKYEFINPLYSKAGLGELDRGDFNDRYVGKAELPNVILQAKIGYRFL